MARMTEFPSPTKISPLVLLREQRSHVLFVPSNARTDGEEEFLDWYRGAYRQEVLKISGILNAQHYERHKLDITQGRHSPLPFRYLALYDLSIDGTQEASRLIEQVTLLHNDQPAAEPPATWLYYPVSEKVGRLPVTVPSMLTIAFANSVPGREAEFREWYATRHIRHALNVPALTSGQCFERTQFQKPSALDALFSMIAVYEQEGTPDSILAGFATLPAGTLDFPSLDLNHSRFAESVYQAV